MALNQRILLADALLKLNYSAPIALVATSTPRSTPTHDVLLEGLEVVGWWGGGGGEKRDISINAQTFSCGGDCFGAAAAFFNRFPVK